MEARANSSASTSVPVRDLFICRQSSGSRVLIRQISAIFCRPKFLRHRSVNQAGCSRIGPLFGPAISGGGNACFSLAMARRVPLTNLRSQPGWRKFFNALTVSLTAAESGIRSRKQSWYIPTRRAARVSGFILRSGVFEKRERIVSRYCCLRSTPITSMTASCRSPVCSSELWIRVSIKCWIDLSVPDHCVRQCMARLRDVPADGFFIWQRSRRSPYSCPLPCFETGHGRHSLTALSGSGYHRGRWLHHS